MSVENLTPRNIVAHLSEYVIGQGNAKRAVAIALRNRYRRQLVPEDLRQEISPKNIIMIGPTGVGKTEIARRLSVLAGAPFVKVEATKYTEVGYVGRDVESMIRDLVEGAIALVKREQSGAVQERAVARARERLLDALLPGSPKPPDQGFGEVLGNIFSGRGGRGDGAPPPQPSPSGRGTGTEGLSSGRGRERVGQLLDDGKLDEREVEVEVREVQRQGGLVDVPGFEAIDFRGLLKNVVPEKTQYKTLKVREARKVLEREETEKLLDMDRVVEEALRRVENSGIVFLDEIDKVVATEAKGSGPDISREGVQRDLLPIIEGTTVNTKHGTVRTDHILFIAAGAFTHSKPSDLIPEIQGRFPIRVELEELGQEELQRILVEPKNSLVRQYVALLATEGVRLTFDDDAIEAIAAYACRVNSAAENIGARRLHTVMERLLDDVLFDAPSPELVDLRVTAAHVEERLSNLVEDPDLSKYIL